ncbi:proline-serine-threonine phosphatase-interacting protein 2-like isoform X1 [Dreissena polymorpha]|uniref:proline-serine-threonine phosphatase-interacting protein 2-like isoform X1 n=1 Tax=Dreissena polymorpha TaxID=45954 RepID=UPI00226485C0|nr:proline-serine-threonine phosphatase-interacting protein 2-like isoform X1 [Dreissena polymorpha]XP_052231508.1 proline-serine-threonine phosphatase-interacting protein 2-like isoform X1 [Dreissena polymorpha]
MTKKLSFSEAFWDSDICGTIGWDRICKRMKDGRKVCTDVVHYLKDRAKAESEYSRALANLARKTDCKDETGGLGESWRVLKDQTVRIAEVHNEAATMFVNLEQELTKFNEDQKKSKQVIDDNVKKYISLKRTEHQKLMNMKKTYNDKCKEYNNAEEQFNAQKAAVTTKKNDLEKAEKKKIKCDDDRKSADVSYKSAVETLENVRIRWENEMEAGCNQFEALEGTRIDKLRDCLWKCTNVDSLACLKHDECSEAVRLILEKCDVSNDLQDFISTNQSGSKRPDPVPYENYYNPMALPPHNRTPSNAPPLLPAAKPIRAGMPPSPNNKKISISDENDYATVSDVQQTSNVLLTVVKDYSAVTYNELTVKKGELLQKAPFVVGPQAPSGMVKVKHQNRVGYVPTNCVQQYTPKPLIDFGDI